MEIKNLENNGMTDFQFTVLLKMIYEIIDSSKNLEEAKSKIKKLIEK